MGLNRDGSVFIGTSLHLKHILVTFLPDMVWSRDEELAIPSVCRIINGMNSHTT